MGPDDVAFRFVLKMALRNVLRMVKGLRKRIGDVDEDVIDRKLLEELRQSSYEVVKGPGAAVWQNSS